MISKSDGKLWDIDIKDLTVSHHTACIKRIIDNDISLKDPSRHPSVILFSVLALEKFAATAENKLTIAKGLAER